jgi:hypothetical protein
MNRSGCMKSGLPGSETGAESQEGRTAVTG